MMTELYLLDACVCIVSHYYLVFHRYDILVTNPPYSTKPFDHIERLMEFCRLQNKPYFILQPCYVYTKDYYPGSLLRAKGGNAGEFYVSPSTRYIYRTPAGLRDVKANALSTSPFVTFWFCAACSHRADLVKWWCERGKDLSKGCTLRLTTNKLPRKYKDSHDETRPRLRKKQREALKRRQDKELGLNPRRKMKKKTARKFNKGDAPHRKQGPRKLHHIWIWMCTYNRFQFRFECASCNRFQSVFQRCATLSCVLQLETSTSGVKTPRTEVLNFQWANTRRTIWQLLL